MKVTVALDLSVYWLEIAFDHLDQADRIHDELLAAWDGGEGECDGTALQREFSTAMQCIVAAAIAMDAFHASVKDHVPISEDLLEAWRKNGTSRPKQIAEILRRGCTVGPGSFKSLRSHLIELFRFRDWCVHPPAGFGEPVQHVDLGIATERRFVAFRFENAKALLGFAIAAIVQLLSLPNPKYPTLVEHCEGLVPLVAPLVERWESRYGELYARESAGEEEQTGD